MLEVLKGNKKNVIKLLEQILNKKISNIIFLGMEHLDSITEYEFSVLKFSLIYYEGNKEEIYLKMIKAGKIKESIFCYWSLMYEDYLKRNKFEENKISVRTSITQQTNYQNNNQVTVYLNSDIDYCVEIDLVELQRFIVENQKFEGWVRDFKIKSEDILFIGRKRY